MLVWQTDLKLISEQILTNWEHINLLSYNNEISKIKLTAFTVLGYTYFAFST